MSDRILVLGAGLLMALSGSASAQTRPGVAFDQITHTIAGTDSSTSVVHMIAAGSDVRLENANGSPGGLFKALPLGVHGVVIMRDGGTRLIMLNPDKKEYISVNLMQMMEGTRKMLEGMGGSWTFDTAASNVHVDSLGSGPVIDGRPTLRYRVASHIRMTLSMMGELNTIDAQSTSEVQASSDLSDFQDVVTTTDVVKGFGGSLGMGKDFLDKAAAQQHRMRGFPLHVVKQSSQTAGGVTRTTTETIDTKNIHRETVPDSLFAVPVDYKLTKMPGMPASGN
jgi:hypothetical protein